MALEKSLCEFQDYNDKCWFFFYSSIINYYIINNSETQVDRLTFLFSLSYFFIVYFLCTP